jgi:HEAT repeat protein
LAHLGGGKDIAEVLKKAHAQLPLTKARTVNNEVEPIIDAANLVGALDVLRTMAIEGVRKRGNHYLETGLTALKVFSDYACAEDVPLLEEILSKPFSLQGTGSNINYASAEVLGKIGGPEARDVLIKALKDPKINSRVKGVIVDTLKSCFPGDPEAARSLTTQSGT